MDNFGFSAHYFALNVGLFMSGNCNAVSDKLGQEFNFRTSTCTKNTPFNIIKPRPDLDKPSHDVKI